MVYVKDTVSGFIEIARSEMTVGQEINIATQEEISIGGLAEKIIEISGKKARIVQEDQRKRPVKSEVERLMGSCERLKELTDWVQKYILEDGLNETFNWFKAGKNRDLYKADLYNV
jgi:dTDP-glucose 4,6-dehydratase